MVQEAVRTILEIGRAEVIYPWNHPKLGKVLLLLLHNGVDIPQGKNRTVLLCFPGGGKMNFQVFHSAGAVFDLIPDRDVPDKTFQKPGVCLNGYHQDITETMVTRKKQEQAIMELLEKVRRANSAKSEFL